MLGLPDLLMVLKTSYRLMLRKDIAVLETGSIIQTHTGEGAFAVMVHYE